MCRVHTKSLHIYSACFSPFSLIYYSLPCYSRPFLSTPSPKSHLVLWAFKHCTLNLGSLKPVLVRSLYRTIRTFCNRRPSVLSLLMTFLKWALHFLRSFYIHQISELRQAHIALPLMQWKRGKMKEWTLLITVLSFFLFC